MLAGDTSLGAAVVSVLATAPESAPGTGAAAAKFTVPNRKPESCSVRLTVPSGWPTKLGMTNVCAGASAVTSKLILGASTCPAFAGGLCPIT